MVENHITVWNFGAVLSKPIYCAIHCSCQQSCGKMRKSTQRRQQQQLRSRYSLESARGHLGRTCFGHQHVLMVHTSAIQVLVALLTFRALHEKVKGKDTHIRNRA